LIKLFFPLLGGAGVVKEKFGKKKLEEKFGEIFHENTRRNIGSKSIRRG